jgi:hypothetical protein
MQTLLSRVSAATLSWATERGSDVFAPHRFCDDTTLSKRQVLLNQDPNHTMAPKSLLRYIFRHGPHSKSRNVAPPPQVDIVAHNNTSTSLDETVTYYQHSYTNEAPESPLAYKNRHDNRPDSRASSVLEDIAEEISSEDQHSDYDNKSIADTLRSALSLDIQTFSTRDLILATLNEAKSADHGHLETINTTLMLLDALDGFSATITLLRDEMLDKKEIYEEKMHLLEDLERAVEHMRFGEDDMEKSG